MEEFEDTNEIRLTRREIGSIKNESMRYVSWSINTAMNGTAELVLGAVSLKGSVDTGHQMYNTLLMLSVQQVWPPLIHQIIFLRHY